MGYHANPCYLTAERLPMCGEPQSAMTRHSRSVRSVWGEVYLQSATILLRDCRINSPQGTLYSDVMDVSSNRPSIIHISDEQEVTCGSNHLAPRGSSHAQRRAQ
jgi:hypothetical protein